MTNIHLQKTQTKNNNNVLQFRLRIHMLNIQIF